MALGLLGDVQEGEESPPCTPTLFLPVCGTPKASHHPINKEGFKGIPPLDNPNILASSSVRIADRTYEILTYREKDKWGTKREIDPLSVIEMDKKYQDTFDNYDYENNHVNIAPNSPCPVLFGIRGNNDKDLDKAKSLIKSEEIDSWLIFETNQGTDDHLVKRLISEISPYQSVIVNGTISSPPMTIEGGHVIFKIKDESGEIDCAAYEPTKEFRNIIRELIIGDKVVVYGGVREKPLTINLEKIDVQYLEKKQFSDQLIFQF